MYKEQRYLICTFISPICMIDTENYFLEIMLNIDVI